MEILINLEELGDFYVIRRDSLSYCTVFLCDRGATIGRGSMGSATAEKYCVGFLTHKD